MKFIRTIIDERSRGKGPVPAPGGPASNRTFTRISADGLTDDTLQRLIAESEAADAPDTDDPLRAMLEDRDDADNLFADDETTEETANGDIDADIDGDGEDAIDGWDDEDDETWSYDDDPAGPDALEASPARLAGAAEQPEPVVAAPPAPPAEAQTRPFAATQPEPQPSASGLGQPVAGRSADPMPQTLMPEPAMPERAITQPVMPEPVMPEPAMPERAAADLHDLQAAMRLAMPAPASGRSGQSVGRVKTRLLGFGGDMAGHDPFAKAGTGAASRPDEMRFPVGWLVIVAGPGRGHAFALSPGVSQIGRGEDQTIRLDFGDTAISRSNHAAIAYDPEEGAFYLGHGGKTNMVRLNNRPVLSTEPMSHGAVIRIGETTLRFAAFCDSSFQWDRNGRVDHASNQ